MARKKKPGTIVLIDLGEGYQVYARELQHPFEAVYDTRTIDPMEPEQIINRPSLFIVAVFDKAFRRWQKVGYALLRPNELTVPDRFIQDVINPEDCRIIDVSGEERPATIEECVGLEAAAIWDSDEVEDRVRDHYADRKNVWLESLKVKRLDDEPYD